VLQAALPAGEQAGLKLNPNDECEGALMQCWPELACTNVRGVSFSRAQFVLVGMFCLHKGLGGGWTR